MTYQSYLALAEKAMHNPQIAESFEVFADELAMMKATDPQGFSALSMAVGMPELQSIHRTCTGGELTQEQREHNERQAQALKQSLRGFGVEECVVLWVVRSWLNALAWPYYDPAEEYARQVEQLTPEQREELAMRGDGAAAGSLARMYENDGDAEQAAKWRKIALDCCDLQTLRDIEYAAAESGVQFKGYDQLLARHASLGDPEGMAAYALALLQADPQKNLEKAFRLAYQSMEMNNSPASCYAMYQCLSQVKKPDFDMDGAAEEYLNDAAEFGYPKAYYECAIKANARGKYEDAYQALLLSLKGNDLYPGTWDGAVLLARYCVEGKGGAPKDTQQAYEWAQRGALHGSAAALGMQGAMEMQGVGVLQNLTAGAAHIMQAAQAGDADSIQRMAMLCRAGVGVDADEQAAQRYAAQLGGEERTESVDGFGFAWIELLSAIRQQQPVVFETLEQEAPEQETPAQQDEEDEEDIVLMPQEPARIEAAELLEEEPAQQEEDIVLMPQEPATEAKRVDMQPSQEAGVLIEMQMPQTPAPSHVPGTMLYCIDHVWEQIDAEMFAMTGEPATDEMLVDLLLVCLCGEMIVFEGDEKKKQAYHGVLAEFDRRMPDFAELGYDRAYLDRRYKELAQAMHNIRMQCNAQAQRDGMAYSWETARDIEREVIGEIIVALLHLSEAMAQNMDKAVLQMFNDLKRQLSEEE